MKRGLIRGAFGAAGFLGLIGAARAGTINYGFEDGTLDGWTNVLTNSPNSGGSNASGNGWSAFEPWLNVNPASNDGNSPQTSFGSWQVAPNVNTFSNPCCPQDNLAHTVVLTSPTFQLDATGSITFALVGGMGGSDSPATGNFNTLPSSTIAPTNVGTNANPVLVGGGFEGVALRNSVTGAYILASHKSSNGASYESLGFTNAQLTAAGVLGNGTVMQLDLIDNFDSGWGWVAMDNVTINGVPEPTSVAFLAIGAVSATVIRRRRVAGI